MQNQIIFQECVPEVAELKTKVFEQMDEMLSDSMVAASSSSCLGPSMFAGGMKNRDRVVVAHPVSVNFLKDKVIHDPNVIVEGEI